MDASFLQGFLGGGKGGLPGFATSSSAEAIGGTNLAPWYQGDVVIAGRDATSGETGPVAGLQAAATSPVLVAAVIVFGAVLLRRVMRKG